MLGLFSHHANSIPTTPGETPESLRMDKLLACCQVPRRRLATTVGAEDVRPHSWLLCASQAGLSGLAGETTCASNSRNAA